MPLGIFTKCFVIPVTEILAGCVGCGVCEMVCPAEPSVIEMDMSNRGEPIKVHTGEGGHA